MGNNRKFTINDQYRKLPKVFKDAISKDWTDNYKQYAKTIKMQYFIYIIDFFKKIKDDNEQIFSWIEEINLGIYQSKPSDNPKIVKKNKKFRFDYEELKKQKMMTHQIFLVNQKQKEKKQKMKKIYQ